MIQIPSTRYFQALTEVPQVVMAVFVSRPTPFLDEFFELLLALEYPKANVCTVDLLAHSTKLIYTYKFINNMFPF